MGSDMKRGMLLCTVMAVAVVVGMPGVASAGGGCHGGVTENDASGKGDVTVRIVDACFTATVTTVDPGTPVTFVNTDDFVHNVGGNEWGHYDDLLGGDAFTVSFDEAGTYPFACTYHPGMTGAIVVGGGKGAAGAEAITVEPFAPPAPKTVTRVVAKSDGLPASFLILAAALGALIGAGAVTLGRTRARRAPVAAA
jgi:plastocyanin